MLPSLARLPVTPTGTGMQALPPELLAIVGSLVDSDDPCRDLEEKCRVDKQWWALCRDGLLYEEVNLRMGFYGTFPSLEAVRKHYEAHPGPWVPPTTAKWYFRAACRAMADALMRGLWSVQGSRDSDFHLVNPRFRRRGAPIPDPKYRSNRGEPLPWYGALAKQCAKIDPNVMACVPLDHPDYLAIARIAVNTRGDPAPLSYIDRNNEAYTELARLSVQHNPATLAYVPPNHPDYVEIAKMALLQDSHTIQHLREGDDPLQYKELAQFVLQRDPSALALLSSTRTDTYAELAMFAIREDPRVFEWVRVEGSNDTGDWNAPDGGGGWSYVELAKFAIQQDYRNMQYVEEPSSSSSSSDGSFDYDDDGGLPYDAYWQLAWWAVEQNPRALVLVNRAKLYYSDNAQLVQKARDGGGVISSLEYSQLLQAERARARLNDV